MDPNVAAKEIHEYVAKLVKPWVDFSGHEQAISEIIRKQEAAEIELLRAALKAEEEMVYTCMERLKKQMTEITQLRAENEALRAQLDHEMISDRIGDEQ